MTAEDKTFEEDLKLVINSLLLSKEAKQAFKRLFMRIITTGPVSMSSGDLEPTP